jgi:hypothetical protein
MANGTIRESSKIQIFGNESNKSKIDPRSQTKEEQTKFEACLLPFSSAGFCLSSRPLIKT